MNLSTNIEPIYQKIYIENCSEPIKSKFKLKYTN